MLKNKYFQIIGGFIAIVFGVLQGIDWLFNKYQIDSYYFNLILLLILISFLTSIIYYLIKKVNQKSDTRYKSKILFGIVSSLLLLIIFYYFYNRINSNQNLINETIPQIIKLYDKGEINKVFLILKDLNQKYPSNEILKNYFDKSSKYVYLKTDKLDIDVSVKYNGDSLYYYLGKTPIDSFLVPNLWNSHNLKLEYNGLLYFKESSDNHDYIFPDNDLNIPDNHKVFLGRSFNRMWFQGLEFNNINISPF